MVYGQGHHLKELRHKVGFDEGLVSRCRLRMIQSSFPNWQFVFDLVLTFARLVSLEREKEQHAERWFVESIWYKPAVER